MTTKIKIYLSTLLCLILVSCSEFLDRAPLDEISAENYFYSEADLAAYTVNYYVNDPTYMYSGDAFPTHNNNSWNLGSLRLDNNTDNQVAGAIDQNLYVKGFKLVGANAGAWNFTRIRAFNYFFENVLPKYEAGEITGNETMIKHYIGEMYFLRAFEYFEKLKAFGDFPIHTGTYADAKDELIEASQRRPRNEVARFIIEDLDKAIDLMSNDVAKRNRLTRDAALLFKSRVALYEASFLKYHQGTPRVPGDANWPGKNMSYNASFTINLDDEINYFLDQCMQASKLVADKIPLTPNSGLVNPASPLGWNPYFEMFSTVDMSAIPEVLFWKAYNTQHNLHCVGTYLYIGGNMGLTKSMVDGFLMKDGSPVYTASPDYYKGDATIMDVKANRDDRLQLFIAGEDDLLDITDTPGNLPLTYDSRVPFPSILRGGEEHDVTGYRVRKCFSYEAGQAASGGQVSTYGSIIFRAVEAYLNYIEASYMRTGTIDGDAQKYWEQIRARAGVSTDYMKTISLTNLSLENDWGAYSAGQLVDATLFNIRRERRNELMSEGLRMMDLKRWRAMDQVSNYIIEGFNLWDKAHETYTGLIDDGSATANVSSKDLSKYLRPFQKVQANNPVYNGLNWSQANYLEPIGFRDIQLASPDGSAGNSAIYQNPYWPVTAGPALE